jgi:hypothetical protein
MPSSAASPVR